MINEQSCQKARNGTKLVRTFIIGILLSYCAVVPLSASAAEVVGESRTYMLYRETPGGDKLMPLYEYLNFSVRDAGMEAVSFHVGGWLRYDLQDDTNGRSSNNEFQYAFLNYQHKENNAAVSLGRIMVFEGVAAERLDGIYARTDLKYGLGVSAFGGSSVETSDPADSDSSTIHGARISHQMDNRYAIGISFLKAEKSSRNFRDEQGLDLWVRPMNKVELSGRSSYNDNTAGWMQHTYNLLLGPFEKVRLNTEVSHINYEDFFAGSTNSAFTFLPGGPIAPKEVLDAVGETVSFAATDRVNVSVDYRQNSYDIAGKAKYYGAKVNYAVPGSMAAGISVHQMKGDTARLSYAEYRMYAMKKYGHTDLTVDLLDVAYDAAINGKKNAYSATVAAGYELTESMMLGADLGYSKNPDFDKDVRLFAKLIYRFKDGGKGQAQPEKRSEAEHREHQAEAPATVSPAAIASPTPVSTEVPAPVPSAAPAGAAAAEQGMPKEGAR